VLLQNQVGLTEQPDPINHSAALVEEETMGVCDCVVVQVTGTVEIDTSVQSSNAVNARSDLYLITCAVPCCVFEMHEIGPEMMCVI
jgi:hypothetical protein